MYAAFLTDGGNLPDRFRRLSFVHCRRSRLTLLQAEVVEAAAGWQELTDMLSL